MCNRVVSRCTFANKQKKMSDQNLEDFVENLNKENPVDIEKLAEAFDQVFYDDPDGNRPIESEHVRGLTVSSPRSVEDLLAKLEEARGLQPDFVQIGDREYTFDSSRSFNRMIDGIRLGSDSN